MILVYATTIELMEMICFQKIHLNKVKFSFA